jgi:hypothetical protein
VRFSTSISSISAPDRSTVAGTMSSRGIRVGIAAFPQRAIAAEQFIARPAAQGLVDAEPGRGVALRIEIDQQHAPARRRQRGRKVDRGGRLAHPTLLVRDRDADHRRSF